MAMTLAGLLAAGSLDLRPVTDPGPDADQPIAWAAVTELADPSPFLSGGEVLLTTGVRQKTVAAQTSFVDRARAAGVVALGYATGLTHARVPAATVRRATEVGLPVFEVPYATPFVAITRMVSEAINRDHVDRLERLLRAHQRLASALLSGGGLQRLLDELAARLGTRVALEQYGAFLHGGTDAGEWQQVPVATGLKDACTLHVAGPPGDDAIVGYAQSLIGVELAAQARLRESRRTTAGQVLGDLARGTVAGQDAVLRLQSVGVAAAERHAVLVAEADGSAQRTLATLPLPPGLEHATAALVDRRLAVVLPAADGRDAATGLAAYLAGAGVPARVSYGGGYAEATGLRWSYFEAVEALRHGQAVNHPSRLSLTSLLLTARDVPIGDLAAEALDPLAAFDAAHGGGLLETLRRYLELDGSVGAVAEDLGLHRNTVRYRLGQIAQLSGFDPTTTADRVQLWLALAARDVGRGTGDG